MSNTVAYSKLESDSRFANKTNFEQLKEVVDNVSVNGGKIYDTLANANADIAEIAQHERVEVYADSTESNNGIWTKNESDVLVFVSTVLSNSDTIAIKNKFVRDEPFYFTPEGANLSLVNANVTRIRNTPLAKNYTFKYLRINVGVAGVLEVGIFDRNPSNLGHFKSSVYSGEISVAVGQQVVKLPTELNAVAGQFIGVFLKTARTNADLNRAGELGGERAFVGKLGDTYASTSSNVNYNLVSLFQDLLIDEEIETIDTEIDTINKSLVRDEPFYYDLNGSTLTLTNSNRTIIRNTALPKSYSFNYLRINVGVAGTLKVGIFDRNTSPTTEFKNAVYSAEITVQAGNQIIKLPTTLNANAGQYIGLFLNTARIYVDATKAGQLGGERAFVGGELPNTYTVTTGNTNYDLFSLFESLTLLDQIDEAKPQPDGMASKLPVNSVTSANSTVNPLFIADTFGLNQPLHPTVLHFPSGFNGYKYVMVQTPYPQSGNPLYKDRYECPTLHFSNDKINWTAGILMDDLTEDEITARSYFSDPELVYNSDTNTLECWYRLTHVNARPGESSIGTRLLRKVINTNGTLSSRQVLMTEAEMTTYAGVVRSQALLYENGVYKMWFTGYQTSSNVGYGYTATPEIPSSWVFTSVTMTGKTESTWHLDIVRSGTDLYFIDNTTPNNLFLYKSTGSETNFSFVKVLLQKTLNNKDYYGQTVYRATGLIVDGLFSVFVSGWNNAVASIGLMEGASFETLNHVDGGYVRQDLRIGGNIRLSNLENARSLIELDDRGHALGFDYNTKSLYFLRADGQRIIIAK